MVPTQPNEVEAVKIQVFQLLPGSRRFTTKVEERRQLRCRILAGSRIAPQSSFFGKGSSLLTEQQISRSWRKLFSTSPLDEQTFEKAEELLDELRPESPLRHRLGSELHELRKRKLQEQN